MFRKLLYPFMPMVAFAADDGTGGNGGGTETPPDDNDKGGGEDTKIDQPETKVNFIDALKDQGFVQGLEGMFERVLSKAGLGKKDDDKESGKNNDKKEQGKKDDADKKDDPADKEQKPEVDPKAIEKKILDELQRKNTVVKAAKKKAIELNWPAQAITDIEDHIPTADENTASTFVETVNTIANAIVESRMKGTNPGDSGKDDKDKKDGKDGKSKGEDVADLLNKKIDESNKVPEQWKTKA